MSVKVHELMTESVVTVGQTASLEEVRRLLQDHQIGAVPVVDQAGQPVGVVSSTDLIQHADPGLPVGRVMTDRVFTVPKDEDVSIAARVMRNQGIHRVVVTHEKKVVGVLSAFDLLTVFETHRFVSKNPPTESQRTGDKRR